MFYWSFTMWWFVMSEDGKLWRWSRWESTKTIFKQPKVFCKQNQRICINIVTNIVIPFGVSFELKKHNRWQRKQSQLIFDSTNWKWVSHYTDTGAQEQEKERGVGVKSKTQIKDGPSPKREVGTPQLHWEKYTQPEADFAARFLAHSPLLTDFSRPL